MSTAISHGLRLFLNRLLLRSKLGELEQRAILALRAHAASLRAGDDLVAPGGEVHSSCLVIAGLMGSYGQLADGRRQIAAMHIAGDVADLRSLMWPTPDLGLQALAASTVLRIPHFELHEPIARYPAIAEAFWRDCLVDASISAQWVVNVGQRGALSRMAHLLCEIGLRSERAGIGRKEQFRFGGTQSQLADALGLTPVHVNRTLQSLRGAGELVFVDRDVRIHDWQRFADLGEFDPQYLRFGAPPAPIRHSKDVASLTFA
jgi:CRP-like cAMP-binding protein